MAATSNTALHPQACSTAAGSPTLVELTVLLKDLLNLDGGPGLVVVQALHELVEARQRLAARLPHLHHNAMHAEEHPCFLSR